MIPPQEPPGGAPSPCPYLDLSPVRCLSSGLKENKSACLNGYTYDVEKARACEAIDEPGFTAWTSSGQGSCRQGPGRKRTCSPERRCRKEAGRPHLPGVGLGQHQGPKLQAFEPQGWRARNDGAPLRATELAEHGRRPTEEPGRGVSGGKTPEPGRREDKVTACPRSQVADIPTCRTTQITWSQSAGGPRNRQHRFTNQSGEDTCPESQDSFSMEMWIQQQAPPGVRTRADSC